MNKAQSDLGKCIGKLKMDCPSIASESILVSMFYMLTTTFYSGNLQKLPESQ